ncbi:MAG: macro domain-containing protein [Pseudomonadota bacterium]|uniref:macro domain-containing protein n=1 Tax=Methyloversatilis sp. TaxID=2569862 RepID=UPI0027373EDD|nr:macro domain-containing protein [Methyloversatilis sp.]MDP3871651.1 macro domain-containing protein [Methyloversatilis sp.]
MIQYVTGDILLSQAQVIAHGIAPQEHFDHGLALALRERWPSMARDYRHAQRGQHLEAGTVWSWAGVDSDGSTRTILNLLTQKMVGDGPTARPGKASLESVNHALKALARYAGSTGVTSIALPRLATGVGGMDWADVKPLVEQHLGSLGIPVIVYETYHQGVAASEQLK